MRPSLPLVCATTLALGFLLASGCSGSPLSRIDSKRAVYESWPVEVQDAVYHGKAIAGMTPEQVEMAMGKPTEVTSRLAKDGSTEDIWSYKKSSSQLPSLLGGNTGVSVGGNVGGVGVSTGTSSRRGGRGSVPEDEGQDIVFKNGVVTRGSM